MALEKVIAEALLGGGKKAMKANVDKVVAQRLKNVPKTVAKPKPVIKAPLVKEVTGGDLAKQEFVNQQLGRRNYGPRKPGSPVRAQRATSRMGPRSIIASEPVKMLDAYPDKKYEIKYRILYLKIFQFANNVHIDMILVKI